MLEATVVRPNSEKGSGLRESGLTGFFGIGKGQPNRRVTWIGAGTFESFDAFVA